MGLIICKLKLRDGFSSESFQNALSLSSAATGARLSASVLTSLGLGTLRRKMKLPPDITEVARIAQLKRQLEHKHGDTEAKGAL